MLDEPVFDDPTNESSQGEQNPSKYSKKKIRKVQRPPNLPLASTPLR